MDLTQLTLREAAAALRRADITAQAYAQALLERAARAAPLNAFIHHDPEQVRAAARAADEARARGAPLGPLHGVPLALKDNIDTAGIATTAGTPALRQNVPARDAAVAQRLLGAGALVFGKANLHELAYGITNNNAAFGPARNPYDPSRIPGASSGGTGVAVGARMVPAGIGSDTGGSVRIPAALCGVVGFRPSTGRWPQQGIVPISHTRDTAGPLARTVSDCVLLDHVVTGAAEVEPANLNGLRLGVPRGHFWESLDAETASVMDSMLRLLKEAGAVLVEADVPDAARLDNEAGFPIALYETVVDIDAYLAEHDLAMRFADVVAQVASPDVKGILSSLLGDAAVPQAAYHEALTVKRPQLQAAYEGYFRQHGVAAVVFPTTPLPAAPIGQDQTVMLGGQAVPTFFTFIRNTSPGSVAGIPGISLPAGMTRGGLPIGLELDGPRDGDAGLLAVARAVEAVLPAIPAPAL
jgi:mandelamide amidase